MASKPLSQIFSNKINVDGQDTPIHHVGIAVGVAIAAVIGIGILNHKANH